MTFLFQYDEESTSSILIAVSLYFVCITDFSIFASPWLSWACSIRWSASSGTPTFASRSDRSSLECHLMTLRRILVDATTNEMNHWRSSPWTKRLRVSCCLPLRRIQRGAIRVSPLLLETLQCAPEGRRSSLRLTSTRRLCRVQRDTGFPPSRRYSMASPAYLWARISQKVRI